MSGIERTTDDAATPWTHCGSVNAPPALARSDVWADRLSGNHEERVAVVREIEATVEAFRPLPTPEYPTAEYWLHQATVHCLNYAMREIKVTDPLYGEGKPFGLPWGLVAGRARLDAIECFKRAGAPA